MTRSAHAGPLPGAGQEHARTEGDSRSAAAAERGDLAAHGLLARGSSALAPLQAAMVQRLQRTIGNRAVQDVLARAAVERTGGARPVEAGGLVASAAPAPAVQRRHHMHDESSSSTATATAASTANNINYMPPRRPSQESGQDGDGNLGGQQQQLAGNDGEQQEQQEQQGQQEEKKERRDEEEQEEEEEEEGETNEG